MSFIDDKEKIRDLEILNKDCFLKSYFYITEQEYDETFKEHIINLAREIAKEIEDINPDSVGYILQNSKNGNDVIVSMSDYNWDRYYNVNIFNPDKTESYPEWDFSFGEDLYDFLAKGYELRWAEIGTHSAIWEDISNGYDTDEIKENKGIQLYIKYCIDNGITYDMVKNEQSFIDITELYIRTKDKEITTLEFLNEVKEMVTHNINCYSDGRFISKAKVGFEDEFNLEQQKLKIVNNLITSEKNKVNIKKEYER